MDHVEFDYVTHLQLVHCHANEFGGVEKQVSGILRQTVRSILRQTRMMVFLVHFEANESVLALGRLDPGHLLRSNGRDIDGAVLAGDSVGGYLKNNWVTLNYHCLRVSKADR